MTEIQAAVSVGLLAGMLFATLRLAGVDYSKWYRNPGEISERSDRSWIGLMKWTSLSTGRRLLGLFLLAVLVGAFVHEWFAYVGAWIRHAFHGDIGCEALLAIAGWHGRTALGLVIGIVGAQAAVESAWRLGLRGHGGSTHIRLAKNPGDTHECLTPDRRTDRRRLVVCCDGTWNTPVQGRETNVVELLRAIKPVGSAPGPNGSEPADCVQVTQIAYYHLGVGTGNFLDRLLGGGAGVGLSSSVKGCYGFLVDNYQAGDEILLFGFSRGAFVARSVAGMIGVIGLLQKNEMFRFLDAWNYYARRPKQREGYEKTLNEIAPNRRTDVEISCIGVWDTVGALGVPGTRLCSSTYAFHDTALGGKVRHAFQALAMDERRGNFQPAVWVKGHKDQVLEQVWFPGVHSNVGGGYREHGLADATLLWMMQRLHDHHLLDVDFATVAAAINRVTAEQYAVGDLKDSRSRFWKAIACPIPRAVGITDDSESIHDSAFQRETSFRTGDLYARQPRKRWLGTIPQAKRARRGALEKQYAYSGRDSGTPIQHDIPAKGGICAWVMTRLFGNA